MVVTERRMTLEEFLALPERKPALEFEDGLVTQKVSPKARHSALQYAIAEAVNQFARRQRIALALPELRSTFALLSRVPDVSVYAWERLPRDADGILIDDIFIPPDVVFEVRSPGQRTNALLRRCESFVNRGVRAAVLVDPYRFTVVVVRPDTNPLHLAEGETLDLSDIVPGLTLSLATLFDALRD